MVKTHTVGQLSIPKVKVVPEWKQIAMAFEQFTEVLNRNLVEHPNFQFFTYRTPSWRGQPLSYNGRGQRLNGVLNVGYTVDARNPVWAPIDTAEFEAYQQGDKSPERCNALAKQILKVLYTVRNNTFHGGKLLEDANDNEVLSKVLPLSMIVKSFIRFDGAE